MNLGLPCLAALALVSEACAPATGTFLLQNFQERRAHGAYPQHWYLWRFSSWQLRAFRQGAPDLITAAH